MNRPPVLFTKALQIRTMGYGTCRLFHDRMADASFFNDHPCLYSGGMLYDCGTLGGLADPFAMNSSGVLVRDGTLPSLSDGSAGAYHAFIYANGRIADLNSLVNLQGTGIRAQVGSGTNALIAGVVVGGQGTSGSEPILLPASGPALAPLGVTGVLPDPKLQLNNSSGTLATNNGWGGSAAVATTAAAVGAFPWTSASSHDDAFLQSAPAGAYTAEVLGSSGDSGVALMEVYEVP